MNMYLTHTFIFAYFFSDYIYASDNAILVFVSLFSTTLLLSLSIEFVKRKIGFYKLQTRVIEVVSAQIPSNCN